MRLLYAIKAEERLLEELDEFGYKSDWVERSIGHSLETGLTPDDFKAMVSVRDQARERRKTTTGGGAPPQRRLDGKPRKNVFLDNDQTAAPLPPPPKPPSRAGRYIRSV